LENHERGEFTPFIPLDLKYEDRLKKTQPGGIEIVELMEHWLLQKFSCWEYENEVRIIINKGELNLQGFSFIEIKQGKYVKIVIPSNTISKIIFGYKANNKGIDKIISCCIENEICKDFEKMAIDPKTIEFYKEKI
jgi:hypothetical protein